MAEITLQELKEKFNTVQNISQSLKEEKIRLESEIKTLKTSYDESLKELLELTGASTLEEATKMYKDRKSKLDADMVSLSSQLNKYLDTYAEETQ